MKHDCDDQENEDLEIFELKHFACITYTTITFPKSMQTLLNSSLCSLKLSKINEYDGVEPGYPDKRDA